MMQSNLIGATIGDFEILSELGRGGMAVVYRARQLKLDRIVALKVLPPELTHDASYVARFQQEARSAARLEHPHIVPIYEVGQAAATRDGVAVSPALHYIVMKYIEGRTLKDLVGDEGALTVQRAADLLGPVAAALDYAHRRQVIHRDIKPSNIMVGNDGWVYLTDFGLARGVGAGQTGGLTMAGTVMGTPEYMSPEQAQGVATIGPATDVYALGVVLYEMLTGGFPFQADTPMGMLAARLLQAPRPPRDLRGDLPLPVEDIIMRALARNPETRFASAGEMLRALQHAADALPQPDRDAATGETLVLAAAGPVTPPTPPYVRPTSQRAAPASARPAEHTQPAPAAAAPGGRSSSGMKLFGLGIAGLVLLMAMAGGLFGLVQLLDDGDPEPPPVNTRVAATVDNSAVQTLLDEAAASTAAGDYEEALDAYEEALEIAPGSSAVRDGLLDLGWTLFDDSDYDGAGEVFEVAVDAGISDADIYYGYGRVLLIEDDHGEAVKYLGLAADTDPADAEKAAWLGEAYFFLAYHTDDSDAKELAYENAVDAYDRALAIDPDSSFALAGMGWALENNGQSEAAVPYFEQSLAIDDSQDETYNGLGWSLYNLNRYREAIAAFEQALALDPDYVNAYYGMGRSYAQLGETGGARQAYQAALEIDPEADHVRDALDELEE